MQRITQHIAVYTLFLLPSAIMSENLNSISYCQSYANTSMQMYNKNISKSCGFSSPRWNNDKKGQYDWCLSVTNETTEKENKSRIQMFNNCIKINNVANIIPACMDDEYIPTKKIPHPMGWLSKTNKYPVTSETKGYIEYDFNSDDKLDNIFIEKKSDSIRVVQCISNYGNSPVQVNYVRKVIPFSIFEGNVHSVGYTASTIHLSNKIPPSLVLEQSYYENNSNGNSDTWNFQYNKEQEDFVLTSYKGSRGKMHNDDEGSNSNLWLDFIKNEYRRTSICPFGESTGCTSSEENGKIEAPLNILGSFNIKLPFYSKFNLETSSGPTYKLVTH